MTAILSVTMLAGSIAVGVFLGEGSANSVEPQETDSDSSESSYLFRVYTLNCSGESQAGAGTVFTFDERELPFDFSEIRFGDFRLDAQHVDTYYGGLCLIIGADGPCANMTFKEGNGKQIQDIRYEGQPLIVLNGWEYVSRDSDNQIIEHRWGSMQIPAYDWRDSAWTPSDGILVECQDDVTISSVSMCLMVFEPSDMTPIPEFGLLPGCIAAIVLIVIVRRARRGS